MSHTSFKTSLALKEAGMPQPYPEFPQIWYHPSENEYIPIRTTPSMAGETTYMVRFGGSQTGFGRGLETEFIFAPDVDYITSLLPPDWKIEMWDGRYSCRVETDEYQIRTLAESTAEAAALVWMELNKKPHTL